MRSKTFCERLVRPGDQFLSHSDKHRVTPNASLITAWIDSWNVHNLERAPILLILFVSICHE